MYNEITCKHCNSTAVVKFGTYNGVQRYWCKVCQRKFKDDDTTFHMKVSPEFVSSALELLSEKKHNSVRFICPFTNTDKSKSIVNNPSNNIENQDGTNNQ